MSWQIQIKLSDRAGHETWIPMQRFSTREPLTWPTYEQAMKAMKNMYAGVLDDGSVRVARGW